VLKTFKVKQYCSGQFPGWEDGIAELRTFVVKQLWSGDLGQRRKNLMVRQYKK